jgi:hypothetical protein
MKFCEWHRVTRMCGRTVILHLDMRFFSQVPTSFKIDAHSCGIMSSDKDVNTFVLLIWPWNDATSSQFPSGPPNVSPKKESVSVVLDQGKVCDAFGCGTERCHKTLYSRRLTDRELSTRPTSGNWKGYLLYTDDQSLGEDKNFILGQ